MRTRTGTIELMGRFTLVFWQIALAALTLTASSLAQADFLEIGAMGNYRKSNIDVGAYDESTSGTASVSYYFDEQSALELSYTNGYSKRFVGASIGGTDHAQTVFYELVGLDFVLTFGGGQAMFRPYIKAGTAYLLKKRLVDQYIGFTPAIYEDPPGFVPSAGIGFKLLLTKSLSLKIAYEGWSSRPLGSDPNPSSPQFDTAARAGFSWIF